MAEQRQGFRFQLPWLQAPSAPRPPQEAPTFERQTPIQPTTTPAQRPPFRPAGLAPAQARPQAQAAQAQPSSPSRATARTRVTSQPAPPSRIATQSQAASQPPTRSRAAIQSQAATRTRVTSQPAPPSRIATQSQAASQPPTRSRAAIQSQAATRPPSPSTVTPQTQDAPQPSTSPKASETKPSSEAAPQPQSPPKLASQSAAKTSSLPSSPSLTATQAQLQPTTKDGSQPPPVSTELPLSVSQEEPKPARSQPESQEPQPKVERTSENDLNAQNQTPSQTTFQPNGVPTQPSEAAATPTSTTAVETPAPTQKSDSSLVSAEPQPLQKSDGNPEETIEGKEMVKELGNKQKINGVTEEPKRTVTEPLTEAPGSEVPTKMHPSDEFDADQEKVKEILATSNSNGKQTKTVISNLRDKNTVSESCHKPTKSNGEQTPLHKEIRDDIPKFVNKMATQQPKHPIDEKPVSVITLAGENRGASMQLGSESAKREGAVHIRRAYKINPDESSEATTDEEGSSEGRKLNNSKTEEDRALKAYINGNVQAMNNSIMFYSSITERNPGVQMVLSRNLTEPVKPTRRMEPLETRKGEFNATPAQNLTYEPTVRRRCLRGLFLESSDSDPDNAEKPRRHGCRYGCKEKSKDNKIDVL